MDNLTFDELDFKRKLDGALREVRRILDTSRHPEPAGEVHHSYRDKYCLSEYLTNTALAALLNVLGSIGLDEDKLSILVNWMKEGRSVWLEYECKETCQFLREQVREEKSKKKLVSVSQLVGKTTHHVLTTIKEYCYKVSLEYLLTAKCSQENVVLITSRKGHREIKTTDKEAPRPKQQAHIINGGVSPDLTFLLKQLIEGNRLAFTIDRSNAEKCRTPVRNPDTEAALKFFKDIRSWSFAHFDHLKQLMLTWQRWDSQQENEQPKDDLKQISAESLFVPVLPMFEANPSDSKDAGAKQEGKIIKSTVEKSSVMLNMADATDSLLDAQKRSIDQKLSSLADAFKSDEEASGLITYWEAKIATCLDHCNYICQQYEQSIAYIENMIHKQLVAAIGKEVTPGEFEKYMRYHEKRLFADAYGPLPFCYAVRRPGHYPEGTVAMEKESNEPIFTLTRHMSEEQSVPMTFQINAATNITFNGSRYLHAFVANKFGQQGDTPLKLVAHARQFSCFMILLGRIGPGNTFQPKHAVLLENKDDLKIPITLEHLPTPKEFKDAIESLSPEQQKFAKAYRSMQLEGKVFGLLIIQLKPQLEKLLKLPSNSLTKEIKLTQDLLRLFIEYQIPSDLLTYEGDPEAALQSKLDATKGHVKDIMEMLENTQKEQLEEAAQGHVQRKLESESESDEDMGCDLFDLYECAIPPPPPPPTTRGPPRSMFSLRSSPRSAPPPPPPSSKRSGSMSRSRSSQPSSEKMDLSKGHEHEDEPASHGDSSAPSTSLDFTKVPSTLDGKFEKLDTDNALRPTILNVGERWEKRSFKSLRGKAMEKVLFSQEQNDEKTRCFDLLDALSCSGSLDIDCASLHVVVAATHCFDESIIDTIVCKSINPIEKMERSILIVASTIHGKHVRQLIKPGTVPQIENHSPQLIASDVEEEME